MRLHQLNTVRRRARDPNMLIIKPERVLPPAPIITFH